MTTSGDHAMRHLPGRITGTRDELLAELRKAETGWWHQGRPDLSSQARNAVESLAGGSPEAQVGHVEYLVTE